MRSKVLIVDDMEMNREMLAVILEEDYPIVEADSGKKAIEILEKQQEDIAVILLDLIMPEMDGYEVLEELGRRSWLNKIPVLVISAESKVDAERRCFELGVSDFIHKPFDNAIVRNRVKNTVDLCIYRNELEEKVEQQTETLKKQYALLELQARKLQESNTKIIDILGTVVESRNLESGEHVKRVKGFTKILAEQAMEDYPEYGLTPARIDIIVSASALHDIGKIAIPDNILLKPGKLTDEEFAYMKTHTIRGCDILNNIRDVWEEEYSKASYDICRHHHERYDGRGYPDKLAGEDIPIAAQLVGIADVYDALVSERVYKSAYTPDEAFTMIQEGKCGAFSPKLMECFRHARERFEALARAQHEG
ncbi:MAG: response regulator [Roseburia sp.]|nr:response regulator [Roseburia sp.]MCM1096621.1 response regulator [Ruminococcus flavefaciens]